MTEQVGGAGDGGYEALRHGWAVLERWERDVVRVAGPDAENYLQGQLSQDVAKLAPGDWAWSLVLQPQGKLVAFVRCFRRASEEFLIDTDPGVGAALVDRLLRFRLRTKAEVGPLDWQAVAVRGPAAPPAPAGADGLTEDGGVTVPFEWHGLVGYDLLGPAPTSPEGATKAGAEAYAAARIEAGFPRHGAELDERTIPAEAGLVDAAVSFTKGCYTGQELVARIDSRGSNVPRHLRGLLLSAPARAGEALFLSAGGETGENPKEIGRLTSVALSPRLGWVALGYVGRSVPDGATVTVGAQTGTARVELLPLSAPGR
jgi:folate-binding protein YgfZ